MRRMRTTKGGERTLPTFKSFALCGESGERLDASPVPNHF
jgi:hypothetical protein